MAGSRVGARLPAASTSATSSATCSARCSTWAASSAAARQQRGDDLRFDLTIDFEDAFFGTETEVKIRRLETCATCHGKGTASGRGPSVCAQCQGRGQMRYQQGFFSVARTCNACGGTGQVIGDPCQTCRGETRVSSEIQADGQGAAGRRRRNADSLHGRRRCGPARRAARRSVCGACRCGRTTSSSARGTTCIA